MHPDFPTDLGNRTDVSITNRTASDLNSGLYLRRFSRMYHSSIPDVILLGLLSESGRHAILNS
jgi:hypothetical protein